MKAAVFDIGATLVTGPPVAPNKVIAEMLGGAEPSDVAAVIMTQPLFTPEDAAAALESRFGPLSKSTLRAVAELWNSQANAAQEIEGAVDTVLALKKRGFKIGLVSDIWTPYYLSVRRAVSQIVESSDAVVLSFETGRRKPDLFNFNRVLEDLRVEPSEAVMIGDTYQHDILPAIELGMHTVWVLARPEREKEYIARVLNADLPAPNFTVSHITQVLDLPLFCPEKVLGREKLV
ncbi:MAG: HAD family hydrolase [Armatimonadota bacterium]|nr:HAD family hydrolase [Armatimonadota bacterium]